MSDGDWRSEAACDGLTDRDHDPWVPDGTRRDRALQFARARRVCQHCPVRLPCARYGLSLLPEGEASVGMFGGLTPADQRAVARWLEKPDRKVAAHGTRSRYVAGCRCLGCKHAHREYEHARRIGARRVNRAADRAA